MQAGGEIGENFLLANISSIYLMFMHDYCTCTCNWRTEMTILYSPKNKPPSLFDLQVLAQVFSTSFISPRPYTAKMYRQQKINACRSTTTLLIIVWMVHSQGAPYIFFNVTSFLHEKAVGIYLVAISLSNTTLVCVLFCITIPTYSLHFHEIVFILVAIIFSWNQNLIQTL